MKIYKFLWLKVMAAKHRVIFYLFKLAMEAIGRFDSSGSFLMHQSIPAVPIPPPPLPDNRGAFAQVVSPGGGAFAILSRPGGWALAYPGADPRAFDTRVFELTWKSLSEKTRPSLKTGLSVTDSKNLWMFLKVCFLNFRYFLIYTCKHINI